ncbi:MAG: hypothetical protein ACQCN6_01820 [Candidatus Bathyarchaeia archaeon]|jgi:hypothetical protein
MSFEEHECYCQVKYQEKGNKLIGKTITMDYVGDGVWKCSVCGAEDDEHKDDIFKARVQIKKGEYNGHSYIEATVIPPFNEKLLSNVEDSQGRKTEEIEKNCLEEFLNTDCYAAVRGHAEGVFDMEILFYDYATGGDGGEREVVIEICKETPVQGGGK